MKNSKDGETFVIEQCQDQSSEQEDGDNQVDSDVDDIDPNNFKGMYYGDDKKKYQDPETGCHFEYIDLCKRILIMKEKRKKFDKAIGLPDSILEEEMELQKSNIKRTTTN